MTVENNENRSLTPEAFQKLHGRARSVAFITLGCKVNSYETEAMWQLFKKAGYERVEEDQVADVFVINTCTVTNTGDKKSRQLIRRAIRKNPNAIVIATGCYAQIAGAELLEIEGLDIVIGTQDRDKLLDLVSQHEKSRQPINAVRNIMETRVYEELDVPEFTEHTRATLKIQEGCNNFCTYCIIPWARGIMRSRQPESVIKQATQLVEAGYKEIVLAGIHTGGYGVDLENYKLANLLEDLDKIEGLKRVRISSIEASQITDEVIAVLNKSDKIARHLHVPVQSASDTVLKRMNRKYTTAEYLERIEKLREALPNLAITSDVIVGFPGETEEEFQETYNFIENMKFSELHVFPYSKRTGTPAAKYPDQVDEDIKNERVEKLIALSEKLSLEYATKFENEILEVIPENNYSEGTLEGYTDNYMRVCIEGNEDLIGKIVRVKITKPTYPISTAVIVD